MGSEIAEIYSEVVGKTIAYVAFDDATFRSMGFPGAAELANMFMFKREDANYTPKRNLAKAQALCKGDKLMTLRNFLMENSDAIPFYGKDNKVEPLKEAAPMVEEEEEEIAC